MEILYLWKDWLLTFKKKKDWERIVGWNSISIHLNILLCLFVLMDFLQFLIVLFSFVFQISTVLIWISVSNLTLEMDKFQNLNFSCTIQYIFWVIMTSKKYNGLFYRCWNKTVWNDSMNLCQKYHCSNLVCEGHVQDSHLTDDLLHFWFFMPNVKQSREVWFSERLLNLSIFLNHNSTNYMPEISILLVSLMGLT